MKRMSRFLCAALAATLCMVQTGPAFALDYSEYDDYDDIVSDVNLAIPQELAFTRPNKSFTTSASVYYLTGNSDPTQDLYLNGELVENRGIYGSFGAYVSLQNGENVFTLQQGEKQVSVTITRGTSYTPVATTKVITKTYPATDVGFNAGDTISLSCNAPAGSTVTAKVGGVTVQLKQNVAGAQKGVAAVFSGAVTAGDLDGTQNIGPVTYVLNYDGATSSYTSTGDIFVAGSNTQLAVQITDTSATVFDRASTGGNFVCTAKKGAVDLVEEIGTNMYRLRMGGWILKSSTQPVAKPQSSRTQFGDVSFNRVEKGEEFIISGTNTPLFAAYQDSGRLHLKFFNTTGLSDLPISESSLFDDVQISEEDGNTTVDLMIANGQTLWGYVVEYRDGNTVIYCKYKPELKDGSQPLEGVNITLDAGHGGVDVGAIGIARLTGATEKEINLATTEAVKKRLEALGAKVSMARENDENPSLNQRLQLTQDEDADFFIALHCNSIAENTDGTKPKGVEVYYYENIAKNFATSLSANISSSTGRNNRGGKYSNYKVTLNSYAPSVLVELGFLTNPSDYDSMRSKQQIYNTANAIADSVIASLQ